MKWINRSVNWDYGKKGKKSDQSFFPVSEDVEQDSYDEEFKDAIVEAYKGDDNFKGVELEIVDHSEVTLEVAEKTKESLSALVSAWASNIKEAESILEPLQILLDNDEFKPVEEDKKEDKVEIIDNFIKMEL